VVKTFRTSRLLADEAIWDDGSAPERRESARIECCMHLRDLANSHPELAPPKAMEFIRQWGQPAEPARDRPRRLYRPPAAGLLGERPL
jgi:hypothetical protein